MSDEQNKSEATDAAEAEAQKLGVDLSEVDGSGKDGKILVKDVDAAAGDEAEASKPSGVDLPEISEESSNAAGVPANEPPELGTVLTPGEPNHALDELEDKTYEDEDGKEISGGLVEDETPRKDDASHAALSLQLAEDGELSHEQLDQIEARQDVSDVRILAAYLRKHLSRRSHREEA